MANLAELVRQAAADRPQHAALVIPGRTSAPARQAATVTWRELDAAVDQAAETFRQAGLRPRDRIALVLGNVVEFPVAYFAALRAGLVAVPINPAYTAREVTHLLIDSGARAALVSPGVVETVRTAAGQASELSVLWVTGPAQPGVPAPSADPTDTAGPPERSWTAAREAVGAASAAPAVGGGEDLAVLLYTSGATGRPKGAMLTHRALLGDLEHVSRIDPPVSSPHDVVLLVLPLFHVFGLNSALGMLAKTGATGVLVERFDAAGTLAVVADTGVTVVLAAPPVFVAWADAPRLGEAFAAVRLAVSGAAPLPAAIVRRFEAVGHVVHEGYGLTEAAPGVTSTLVSPSRKPGSVGRPLPGVELQLVDAAGNEVDQDDPGEIRIRGTNLFSGYWPNGRDGPDADGWWCTGDVAVADADGDLWLVDRRTELILVSGFNVYPREVENVLASHPAVAEVAVLGVPDASAGEAVKALVVCRPGQQVTVEELREHCARNLARFKCPTQYEFLDELPYTPVGKVAKARLRVTNPDEAAETAEDGDRGMLADRA